MKPRSALLLACVVLTPLTVLASSSAKTTKKPVSKKAPTPEAAAKQAAASWLALVDSGKYAESWDAAALAFQSAVTRDQWVSAIQPVREPLGALKTRKVQSAHDTTTLPNTPPGEYVVITYNTTYEKKSPATETVAMMRGKDGKWKSSGYFIK